MKLNRIALYAALALASPWSLAAGDHAGGHSHGHGSDESAIGLPGVAGKVTRTIAVDMTDAMRFTPASIEVRQGETIRFEVTNSGKVKHEFVLGTDKALKDHYQLMLKFPEMEHEEPNMITLAAGQTGEVVWRFTRAGKVDFACLQPGHYDAGMKGVVSVAASKTGSATQGHRHPH